MKTISLRRTSARRPIDRPRVRSVLGPAVEALERRNLLTAYVVDTTADIGPGSLRQAILDANAHSGADQITFAIPGAGTHTIASATALPAISDAVSLDATTQPAYAGTPLVELSGVDIDDLSPALELAAGASTVTGFAITGFGGAGVQIDAGAAGAVVRLNFIGTDPTGTIDDGNLDGVDVFGANATVSQNLISGNDGDGVFVSQAASATISGNRIGVDASGAHPLPNNGSGVSVADSAQATVSGNVISASGANGVSLLRAQGAKVTGNLIGTDASGLLAADDGGDTFGNQGDGVTIDSGSQGNTIGGTTATNRNVISNSAGNGVYFAEDAAANNVVQGNYIGTDAAGANAMANLGNGIRADGTGLSVTSNVISGNAANGIAVTGAVNAQGNCIGTTADGAGPLGNAIDGIYITGSGSVIGGTAAGAANVVAFNGFQGVTVASGNRNLISRNSIFSNLDIGIDLGGEEVTLNDSAGHADANLQQNFPALASAQQSSSGVTVQGTLNAAAYTVYTIELFGNVAPDPTGYGEGQTYLGTTTITTNASGKATFSTVVTVPTGQAYVSATATDPAGNTSEFSQDVKITTAPPPVILIPTTTTLASSLNPSHYGQSVTFTAHVTAATGTPTGIVTFKEGSLVLGIATLDASANARISTSTLSVGDHTIIAYYGGNTPYLPSTSPPLVQHVLISPASASGRTLSDRTGNGLSSDDTPLPGVTVAAFLDRNNNGVLDAYDGAAVATTTSSSVGTYAFTSLNPFSRYFVQEVVPSGYVRTAPALNSYYVVSTGDGTSSPNNDFDNFKTCDCSSALKNIQFTINGSRTTYSSLTDHVHEGDTVKATFTVPAGQKVTLSLVSYAAPDPVFYASDAGRQKIYKYASGTFGAGTHSLTVTAPRSFFQIDFVCGLPIDRLGPANSNIFYTPQKRLISSDNGGTHTPITSMLYT